MPIIDTHMDTIFMSNMIVCHDGGGISAWDQWVGEVEGGGGVGVNC